MDNNIKKLLIGIVSAGAIIAVLMWLGNAPETGNRAQLASGSQILSVAETTYDFGRISMAKGSVIHTFAVRNTSTEPARVRKLYTSCMCTEALLDLGEKRVGPFGMPGHGFIPSIDETLAPGQEATVEVTFDPAAHGSAGVGAVNRVVTLEHEQGTLQLRITAFVTP